MTANAAQHDQPELNAKVDFSPVVGLTERERLFAEAFVELSVERGTDMGVAPLAYRRAFPLSAADNKSVTALASKLRKNPRVQTWIERLRADLSAKAMVPASRVVEEMERVAFSNLLDFVKIDPLTGEATIDLRNLDARAASAIAELVVEEKYEGKGPPTRKIKIKLWSKTDALDKLARVHGVYQDKLNVSLTVEDLDRAMEDMKKKLIASGQMTVDGQWVDVTPEALPAPQEASDA